jgi:hypothetical protein
LFKAGGVAARPGFPSFPAPGLAIREFLATLKAKLVERVHLFFSSGFLFFGGLWVFHDHVHSTALAFPCDDLLGRLGIGRIGR